jgi:hypothetical protein
VQETIFFDFFGFQVAVRGNNNDVLQDVHRDFSYFRIEPGAAQALLELSAGPGPRDIVPPLKAALQTPRNTVYREGDLSYVDYFGQALMIYQTKGKRYRIYCSDRDLAHEIVFLTILSLVGEHLDAIGLHRVHALGIEVGGQGVLVLLPMAGGKTTLTLSLLRAHGIKLLSEDSPLISGNGEILPFPLRLGVRVGGEPAWVPTKYRRTVKRMEFGPKTLIDIEFFKDRIAGPCPAGAILLGERWLAGPSSVRPAARHQAVAEFIKNSVVGLGLYQGVEFLLERSAWEILGKAGLALSRLRTSLKIIGRSQVYRFAMGPDAEQSAEVLIKFLGTFAAGQH